MMGLPIPVPFRTTELTLKDMQRKCGRISRVKYVYIDSGNLRTYLT
jgi:hypothetical protein